jgi:Activator of Hsp90 ATPase homolog 1-like protein
MSEITAIEPVVKSLYVDCTVERAFEVFTGDLAAWWPTEMHSIHGNRVRDVVVEGREGGEVYEVSVDGDRAHWGTVTTWEPPERLVVAWRVNPAAAETEWEARFSVEGQGTRLEFEHRFWERLGEGGADSRESYNVGWDTVLARYVDGAATRV